MEDCIFSANDRILSVKIVYLYDGIFSFLWSYILPAWSKFIFDKVFWCFWICSKFIFVMNSIWIHLEQTRQTVVLPELILNRYKYGYRFISCHQFDHLVASAGSRGAKEPGTLVILVTFVEQFKSISGISFI